MGTPKYKTLQECINQIKKCGFEDQIGHPIENNIGYIQLVERAKATDFGFPKKEALALIGKKCYAISGEKVLIGTCKEVWVKLENNMGNDGYSYDTERVFIQMVDKDNMWIKGQYELPYVAFSEEELAEKLKSKA